MLLIQRLSLTASQRSPDLLLVLIRQGLSPGLVAAPDLAARGLQDWR